jgi:hypothetical protein
MHASDLANHVVAHPGSTLAALPAHGVRYPNALTSVPSSRWHAGPTPADMPTHQAQPRTAACNRASILSTPGSAPWSGLHAAGLDATTQIIISAKHGQSPINVAQREAVSDAPYGSTTGYAASTTDDVALVLLDPALQQEEYKAAEAYLDSQASILGIVTLLDKSALAPLYHNPFGSSRTPDFIAITKQGLIYTSGTKLAEHGGFAQDDRNVALLVSNPLISAKVVSDPVETRQIAATILQVLGMRPQELDGARQENTKALPGF